MVSLIVVSIAVRSVQDAEPGSGFGANVTLKWLATAGWKFNLVRPKILINPFLTRKQPITGEEWKTDETGNKGEILASIAPQDSE